MRRGDTRPDELPAGHHPYRYPPHDFTPFRIGLDVIGHEARCRLCGLGESRHQVAEVVALR